MNIQLGTAASEVTFTNAGVFISRRKVASSYILLDGSKKVQEAEHVKRLFEIILFKPTSAEITNMETEYDKGTTLNLIFKAVTYTVKFIGNLDKSTRAHEIEFTLQEV